MKRLFSILILGLLFFGAVFAVELEGDLWDWMDNLNNNIPFGYTINQKISVDQIDVDKIILKSPVIQDDLGNKIKKYTAIFSQHPLSKILENTTLLAQSREKTFEFTTVGTEVTMELTSLVDGINPSVVYYVSIIPKDDHGILGEISNELRFKLATQTYGEGTPTTIDIAAHAAPGANMRLANITHTISNNRATLRWTAVDGSDKIDIFLWNPTNGIFERIAIVNMSDEMYTFPLTRNGEHILNFIPNNRGTEYRYSFIAHGVTALAPAATTTPIIGDNIPATGPEENILIALAVAFVMYLVYRRIRAKR